MIRTVDGKKYEFDTHEVFTRSLLASVFIFAATTLLANAKVAIITASLTGIIVHIIVLLLAVKNRWWHSVVTADDTSKTGSV